MSPALKHPDSERTGEAPNASSTPREVRELSSKAHPGLALESYSAVSKALAHSSPGKFECLRVWLS
jgi:hypothetical protein